MGTIGKYFAPKFPISQYITQCVFIKMNERGILLRLSSVGMHLNSILNTQSANEVGCEK